SASPCAGTTATGSSSTRTRAKTPRSFPVGWRSSFRTIVALLALASLGACGRWAVRPNEKEHLADRTMRFDAEEQETASDDHILDNREGATGGGGTSGGGCGCN